MDDIHSSKSSSPFSNPLVTVSKAPITIGIIVTFLFHSFFFQFPSKVEVLIILFTFFQFNSVVSRDSKVDNFSNSNFFLLIIIRSGHLVKIRWPVSMSKSHTISLPTQSCLVLYSFCANLLHSLFFCVLSILVLIWLFLTALFCAALEEIVSLF